MQEKIYIILTVEDLEIWLAEKKTLKKPETPSPLRRSSFPGNF